MRVNNLPGEPEINNSYNVKLAYYPKNGLGRYSISYYYKVVDNAWETIGTYNDDPLYAILLDSMGLSPDNYENSRVSTITATGK
ncbi:MAG: hypothetical protein J6386_03750 [Candidatus Synoicihabitans palmerolidicus]|nr:hypothetical protein [Candidatus Synoicihabitans palmerolidicus]